MMFNVTTYVSSHHDQLVGFTRLLTFTGSLDAQGKNHI